jgi:predicted flap endonuclease-1-like 5' DNA nuclease
MKSLAPKQGWSLDQIPGLNAEDSSKLKSAGFVTTAALLRQTRTPQQQRQLATQLQMPERWVRKWAALAELSELPSVGCQYCGVLLHAGVTSVAQLASMQTHTLHRQVLRLQVAVLRRRDLCPNPGVVTRWITEAQQYQHRRSL